MTSWVHLFSKFTPEALLFEAALICFVVGAFIAYTVIRKRRRGQVGEEVPSTVVKVYLNELISEAEQMRSQLFGLLQSSGIMTPGSGNSEAGKAAILASLQASMGSDANVGDSEVLLKIAALETRMKEQSRAMELLIQDKLRIQNELSLAKNSATRTIEVGSSPAADTGEFQRKIAQLEAKLAEYSVIEDDLANLKRLQQENAELKSRLGQPGTNPAQAPVSAVAVAATAAAAPSVPHVQNAMSSAFDQLASQVNASLVETPSAEAKSAEEGKPNEADLLAEFEKMLNG